MKKGQASTEALISIGFLIVFLIPLILFLFVAAQTKYSELAQLQAESTANLLADTINEVYLEGPGASKQIVLSIPAHTDYLEVRDSGLVVISLSGYGGEDIVISSPFFGKSYSGFRLTDKQGNIPVVVSCTPQGDVVIMEATQ